MGKQGNGDIGLKNIVQDSKTFYAFFSLQYLLLSPVHRDTAKHDRAATKIRQVAKIRQRGHPQSNLPSREKA